MEISTTSKRRYSKGAIKIPVGYSGISMDELKDDLFGEEGTSERDLYETELGAQEKRKLIFRSNKHS